MTSSRSTQIVALSAAACPWFRFMAREWPPCSCKVHRERRDLPRGLGACKPDSVPQCAAAPGSALVYCSSRSSSATVSGLRCGGCVARKTPSAQTSGVRPCGSGHVELGAVRREELDDVVRAAVGGAVDRRAGPSSSSRSRRCPSSCAELDCVEQRRGPFVERLIEDPVHAGGRHQRRRARERGDGRVGAVLEQQAHDGHVARERGAQERRLAREVDPRQRAERRR